MEGKSNKITTYVERCLKKINDLITSLVYKRILRYTEKDVSKKTPCGISRSNFHFKICRIKRRDRPDFFATVSYPQTSSADVIPTRLRKISSFNKQTAPLICRYIRTVMRNISPTSHLGN